ncbi:MAG: hypothetical protein JJ892_04350 [Balneola sp.]|nr:hypothetical protein [Balneola sp.]MBO6651321.1 hypothetical protein [Balneola sp.]MBO6710803.1 hypothetical protein [Balneola sp.]MBO6799490.1 hypothetical protein [Balneola sp.]MBO6870222.1 hypothetical protein [Balneola sp.]
MKRLTALILFFALLIGIDNGMSQKGLSFEISYYTEENSRRFTNKDIREFHAFQKDLDNFFEASQRNKVRKAVRIKKDILRRMRSEINDTKEKIWYVKRELTHSFDKGLHKKNSRGSEYSKRSGKTVSFNEKALRLLHKQLSDQRKIVTKLENMYLYNGRDFFIQARRHQRLMEDFEQILKDDINFSFKEYRSRNRRGK